MQERAEWSESSLSTVRTPAEMAWRQPLGRRLLAGAKPGRGLALAARIQSASCSRASNPIACGAQGMGLGWQATAFTQPKRFPAKTPFRPLASPATATIHSGSGAHGAPADTSARRVQLGNDSTWSFPSRRLQQLEDANHLLGDGPALRAALREQGYLFIRGLHDRHDVLNARLAVLKHVDKVNGGALELRDHRLQEGVLEARCGAGCVPFMEGRNSITHSDEVLRVLEGPRAVAFFSSLFGEDVRTFDFKWLRAMHRTGYTGAHVDNVYMSRGTDKLLTCWQPLGDVTVDMGTLAVCEGSHKLAGFDHFQQTYGNFDVEAGNLKGTGWFTEDPKEIQEFGGQWKTSDFRAGDALIFTLRTVHMSTANQTHFARVSCDTRWQPAAQAADPRYVGNSVGHVDAKFGVYAAAGKGEAGQETPEEQDHVLMENLRHQWGI